MKFKMSKNWLLAAVLSVTSLFVSVPKANAQVCDLSLPTTVNYDFIVNNYFPDLALNPAFIAGSASPNVIVTANNTSVTIGYVGKNASWDHRLGYYRYDGSNAIIPGSKTLISFPNNPPQARDLATVGPFNAGDRVGFFVDVYTGGLTEPISHTLYSSINLNSDNITHFAVSDVSVLTGITGLVAVGFEDKLQPANPVLRDIDYNDYIFAYKACGQVDNCSIPNGVCNSTQCTNDPDCECQPGQNEQQACSNTAGVCNSGTQSRTCGQDGRWGSYSACSIQPGTETCNGLDDNCNGIVDEGVQDVGQACDNGQSGACSRTGLTVCVSGRPSCNAPSVTPPAEVCDGVDNDCDGSIDEDNICLITCEQNPRFNTPCQSGEGLCQTQGSYVCSEAGVLSCNATAGAPQTEICNGIDDNCNGQVDEGFDLGQSCSVGEGLCQSTGVFTCNSEGEVSCNVVAGTANVEICDNFDNDCDGEVDEEVCIVPTVCGNGSIEAGEACDDANLVNGDGCSSLCSLENTEPVCGNGLGEPGEACDDGNLVDGDGCSSTCSVEQTPAIVSPTSPAPAISSPADQFQGSGEVVSGGCSLNGQSSTQYLGLISMVFSLIILAAMRKKKLS